MTLRLAIGISILRSLHYERAQEGYKGIIAVAVGVAAPVLVQVRVNVLNLERPDEHMDVRGR